MTRLSILTFILGLGLASLSYAGGCGQQGSARNLDRMYNRNNGADCYGSGCGQYKNKGPTREMLENRLKELERRKNISRIS
ncbi:MAG: hypothetical protein ABIH89_00850 [Elusimicrobiota bacterium]